MSSICLSLFKAQGQKLQITELPVQGILRDRLSEFGLIEGSVIELRGQALGKGPLFITFAGLQIALRFEEASQVKVISCDPLADKQADKKGASL